MYNITTLKEADFGGLYFISEVIYLNDKIFYLVKIGQAVNIKSRMSVYNTHNTAYHNFPSSAIQIEDKEERDNYENIAHTFLRKLSVYGAVKCKEWFYVSEYVFNNIKDNPWALIFDEKIFNQLYQAPETKIKYKEINSNPEIKEQIIYQEKIVYKEKDNIANIEQYKKQYETAKKDADFYKQMTENYSEIFKTDKLIEKRIDEYTKLGCDLSKRGFWGRLMFALNIY